MEELCHDVLFELLKSLLISNRYVTENFLSPFEEVIRDFKAFRAVNTTFRFAFDRNSTGCRILRCYVSAALTVNRNRVTCLQRFLAFCGKHKHKLLETRSDRKAHKWVVDFVNKGLLNNPRHYIELWAALNATIKLNETALPKGVWYVSVSSKIDLAPIGTMAWAESIMMPNIRRSNPDLTMKQCHQYAKKIIWKLLRIEQEA